MDQEALKSFAGQLRQPQGEYAIAVGEKMNQVNLHINQYSIEALHLATDDNVLEIGMGNGFFVKDIVSNDSSIKYTGCDFSQVMVEEAIKQNETFVKSEQARFYLAGAEKLPFDNETFNKVFSVNTIYFWNDQQLALSEIWRILKPGGKIVIAIRPKSIMQHYEFVKYGFALFSKDELINLLSKSNFKVTYTLEKEEPDQEINGEKLITETLLVSAEKMSNQTRNK